MTIERAKKLKDNSNLLDISYLAFLMLALRFAKKLFENGALYSLAAPLAFEVGRAVSYWMKSADPKFKDSPTKKWLNRAFYTVRAAIVSTGLTIAMMGMFPLGFTLLNSMGYFSVARSLGKMGYYAHEGNEKKVRGNLAKVLIGGMITVGFTLMTFFPLVNPWIAFSLIFGASSFVLISTVIGEAPPLLLKAMGTEKKQLQYMKVNDDDSQRMNNRFSPLLNQHRAKTTFTSTDVATTSSTPPSPWW